MDHAEKTTNIRFVFHGSALFDGRSNYNHYDVKKSAQEYATRCQQALKQAYQDAKVEVFDADASGVPPGLTKTEINDQSDTYEVEAVEQLCDEIYNEYKWEVPRQWLTIPEAYHRFKVPAPTIRWACMEGLITEAEKSEGRWGFPLDTFVDFMDNKVLVNCRGVVGIDVADDGAYTFECYPEDILDNDAADFPPGIQNLIIVASRNLGVPSLFSAESSSVLISKSVGRVDLMFEHFDSETPWSNVWAYDVYAKVLADQAVQRGVDSKYDNGDLAIRFSFDASLHKTLRELIAQAVDILSGVVRDAELSLAAGPV
jgi:hypothetical protein